MGKHKKKRTPSARKVDINYQDSETLLDFTGIDTKHYSVNKDCLLEKADEDLTKTQIMQKTLQAHIATLPGVSGANTIAHRAKVRGLLAYTQEGSYNLLRLATYFGDWYSVKTLIEEKGSVAYLPLAHAYTMTEYRDRISQMRNLAQYNLLHMSCYLGADLEMFDEAARILGRYKSEAIDNDPFLLTIMFYTGRPIEMVQALKKHCTPDQWAMQLKGLWHELASHLDDTLPTLGIVNASAYASTAKAYNRGLSGAFSLRDVPEAKKSAIQSLFCRPGVFETFAQNEAFFKVVSEKPNKAMAGAGAGHDVSALMAENLALTEALNETRAELRAQTKLAKSASLLQSNLDAERVAHASTQEQISTLKAELEALRLSSETASSVSSGGTDPLVMSLGSDGPGADLKGFSTVPSRASLKKRADAHKMQMLQRSLASQKRQLENERAAKQGLLKRYDALTLSTAKEIKELQAQITELKGDRQTRLSMIREAQRKERVASVNEQRAKASLKPLQDEVAQLKKERQAKRSLTKSNVELKRLYTHQEQTIRDLGRNLTDHMSNHSKLTTQIAEQQLKIDTLHKQLEQAQVQLQKQKERMGSGVIEGEPLVPITRPALPFTDVASQVGTFAMFGEAKTVGLGGFPLGPEVSAPFDSTLEEALRQAVPASPSFC